MKERRVKVREMSERREFIRFEIDQMIELSYDREKFVQASGIDLSEKGLQCTTSEYVEPYTKLYLMFQVPLESTTESVQCEGIVIRSLKSGKSYSTSVTFTNIDANDRKIIEEYSERILEPLFEKKRQQKKRIVVKSFENHLCKPCSPLSSAVINAAVECSRSSIY